MIIIPKCLTNGLFEKCLKTVNTIQTAKIHNRAVIGNRDWVAFGSSGCAYYADDLYFPFPAVRFKENTNELLALREKEKGDWRKLTIEEKKTLYRASFRQTLREVDAPTGTWKSILGMSLILISCGIWTFVLQKLFLYDPKPHTFSEAYRAQTLRRMLDLRTGHLSGVSSKWDYENDNWKK